MRLPDCLKVISVFIAVSLLSACDDPPPGPPGTIYESHCVFPYVRNDATYNSVVTVYNNTAGGNYTTDVEAIYRDENADQNCYD